MKTLKGKLTLLRAPEPEDLELFYRWENDTSIWQASSTLAPFSKFTLRRYIESSHLDIYEAKEVRFMIETLDKPCRAIGTIDVFDFDPFNLRAGIGILIGELSDRGKGFAGDALNILLDYASSILKLHQVYCNIQESNTISLRLFQDHGFVITGVKRQWNKVMNGFESELFLQHLFNNPTD